MEKIQSLDVSLLIINGTFCYPGDFLTVPIETHRTTFDTNIVPALILPRLMVDKFLMRPSNVKSGLIYVGCSSSYSYPIPGYGVFTASRAYQDFMGTAIGYELRHRIDGLSYTCGPVASKPYVSKSTELSSEMRKRIN